MTKMAMNPELEILLKKAVTLLHSSEANSAQELRLMLDEEIQKRYGSERTFSKVLSKKHLEAEANFPGRAATPPPPKPTESEIINLTNSPAKTISDSPDTIIDSDDAVSGQVPDSGLIPNSNIAETENLNVTEDETNLKEFGDLNCCVCAEMMFTATNRLIECVKCGALYHQECHKPAITDEEVSDEQAHNWHCDTCLNKPSTSKAAGIVVISDEAAVTPYAVKLPTTSSRSSSSDSSLSLYKDDTLKSCTTSATVSNTMKMHDDKYISPCTTQASVITTTTTTTTTNESNINPHQHNITAAITTVTLPTTTSLSHSTSTSSKLKSSPSSSRYRENKKNRRNSINKK